VVKIHDKLDATGFVEQGPFSANLLEAIAIKQKPWIAPIGQNNPFNRLLKNARRDIA
jgi:hypothetical protein